MGLSSVNYSSFNGFVSGSRKETHMDGRLLMGNTDTALLISFLCSASQHDLDFLIHAVIDMAMDSGQLYQNVWISPLMILRNGTR